MNASGTLGILLVIASIKTNKSVCIGKITIVAAAKDAVTGEGGHFIARAENPRITTAHAGNDY